MKLNDLIQRVRSHPGLPSGMSAMGDDDFAFAVGQLVFPVLNDLCEHVAADRNKRHYIFTDPLSVVATLDGSGNADLSTLITGNGILLESLKYGNIFPPVASGITQPFRMLDNAGQGQLSGAYDALILKCWLEGTVLHTKSQDNNATPLVGDISFEVPHVPGLDALNVQLEDELVDRVVLRLRGIEPEVKDEA